MFRWRCAHSSVFVDYADRACVFVCARYRRNLSFWCLRARPRLSRRKIMIFCLKSTKQSTNRQPHSTHNSGQRWRWRERERGRETEEAIEACIHVKYGINNNSCWKDFHMKDNYNGISSILFRCVWTLNTFSFLLFPLPLPPSSSTLPVGIHFASTEAARHINSTENTMRWYIYTAHTCVCLHFGLTAEPEFPVFRQCVRMPLVGPQNAVVVLYRF